MATWHQKQAPIDIPSKGYVMVSDGRNRMTSIALFGERGTVAIESLDKHRENQPDMTHLLYHDGKLIA